MKLRKGDTVQVLSGNDKGKKGEVLSVSPKTGKVVVKGVNIRSKVQIVCPKCGKAVRIGYKIDGDKKIRVCKACGAELK